MDKKIEHLKMIQEVIGRLSGYSNTIKSWTVSLITVTVTLGFGLNNGDQIKVALIMSLIIATLFMCLDIYYYMLEKSYRNLFDRVRTFDENEIDFRLSFKEHEIQNNIKYQGILVCPLAGLKSPSINLLYIPLIIVGIIALVLL